MILESVSLTMIGFICIIGFLLLFIAKFKWHVFFAMLLPIVGFALIPGVDIDTFIDAFGIGFGNTLGNIAVVIVLGSIMAEALKHTGAIQVITKSMVNLVGEKRIPLALTLSGFIIGTAVFSDIGYVILNPLIHSAAALMEKSMSVMSTGLMVSMDLTHAIVPPTPGPLAAIALLDADIGKVIIWGSLVAFIGAIAAWIWGEYIIGPKINALPSKEFIGSTFFDEIEATIESESRLPSTFMSYLPIIVPIILIAIRSTVALTLPEENILQSIFGFLGWPVVALGIGVVLSYINIMSRDQREASKDDWVEEGLRTSAMILVVTGLGGALSEILKGTPAVDTIVEWVMGTGMPSILIPFIIGSMGKLITGSVTVAIITVGSLVAPMLSQLGLSPEAAMLAGASGSIIVEHVNSSYFWVVVSLNKMETKDGILSYSLGTLIGGTTAFIATCILWIIGII